MSFLYARTAIIFMIFNFKKARIKTSSIFYKKPRKRVFLINFRKNKRNKITNKQFYFNLTTALLSIKINFENYLASFDCIISEFLYSSEATEKISEAGISSIMEIFPSNSTPSEIRSLAAFKSP